MDIRISNLTIGYGEKLIYDNYSATFREHETSYVTGPSGNGKTTLLKLLLGLEKPLRGTIKGVPKDVSAVFQENRLAENFSALSNAMSAANGASRKKAVGLLAELGIPDPKKKVRELSGGEKRRVSIARALLRHADLYIFDEPFSSLDAETAAKVKSTIEMETAGKTVIIAVHSIGSENRNAAEAIRPNPQSPVRDITSEK